MQTGWSLEELAERAGVSRSTLHHLEHGTTPQPRLLTLHRVARALGVAVESLVGSEAAEVAVTGSSPRRPSAGDQRSSPVPPEIRSAPRNEGRSPVGQPARVVAGGGEGGNDHPGAVDTSLFRDGIREEWTLADWAHWESQREATGAVATESLHALAVEINRHRETRRQLQVLLHSPFAQVAVRMIQTLFETACEVALPGPPRCA